MKAPVLVVLVIAATTVGAPAARGSGARSQPPPRFKGRPIPSLLDHAANAAVTDGLRYVAYGRGGKLRIYDSRRNRILSVNTKCLPISGAYGRFLLACDPRLADKGDAILAVSTRRVLPVQSPNPSDSFTTIGRYWLRGEKAISSPNESEADVYLNLRTSQRIEVTWGSTGIPGYAPARDINSPDLAPAPLAGEPYSLYWREGRLELAAPLDKPARPYLRDLRTGRLRRLCPKGCSAPQLGAGRVSWFRVESSGTTDSYSISVFNALSHRTSRWLVVRAPSLGVNEGSVFAAITRWRLVISVVSQTREGDHGPIPAHWRIYTARLPRR